jgi:AraC family transcriptional activator of pobA
MTDTFQYIVENCVKEFHANKIGRALMLQTLTYQIIVMLSRLEEIQSVLITRSQTKAEKLFRQFKQSVKSSYDYRKTVESYAAELGISVNYLHRVCKEIANRPPKDLIIDFFINESKHLLQDVNKPISQISYQLHFEDPAYYTRIFKKRTGMTPKEFREILFT